MFLLPYLALLFNLSNVALASTIPCPSKIAIDSASLSGNGCPNADNIHLFQPKFSKDRSAITFQLATFNASIGPDTSDINNQVNCALEIYVTHPSSAQFRVTETNLEGSVALEDGITARLFADTFPNLIESEAAVAAAEIQGGGVWAEGQVFSSKLSFYPEEGVFSNCGTTWSRIKFAFRVQLVSENPDSYGTFALSGKDGGEPYTQGIALEWEKCSSSGSRDWVGLERESHGDTRVERDLGKELGGER